MPGRVRPRRSLLFVPGANPRAIAKARTLDPDIFAFDLEDSVAPDAKASARAALASALGARFDPRREVTVRVNGLRTPWGRDDLAAGASMAVDGVLLPKVESADEVREAEQVLMAAGAPATLGLWCMIETPLGVLEARAIAGASTRVVAIVMGTEDLAKDLGAEPGRDRLSLMTALQTGLLAARANGLAAIDGIHADLGDEEGFAAACRQGRALGFDGKSLIHPKTIATANGIFGPSADQCAQAARIVAAHHAAVAAGSGVTVLDGRLVERLHVEAAERLLALAGAIAALDQPTTC